MRPGQKLLGKSDSFTANGMPEYGVEHYMAGERVAANNMSKADFFIK